MKIVLFGMAKDVMGKPFIELQQEGETSVKELKERLMNEFPAFRQLPPLGVAVNATYAKEEDVVNEQDEVVLIPPVSGG